MANPIFNPLDKIFTGEYGKYRNLGKLNKSLVTDWEYEWANLTSPQGEGPYDEEDMLILGSKKSRVKLNDLTMEDYWDRD